jgi:hypothetical protein
MLHAKQLSRRDVGRHACQTWLSGELVTFSCWRRVI